MPNEIASPIDPAAVMTAEQQMLTPRNERRMRALLDGLSATRIASRTCAHSATRRISGSIIEEAASVFDRFQPGTAPLGG